MVSKILRPTLYEGWFEYGSKMIVSAVTVTKEPLMKYTPVSIFTALPVAAASISMALATLSPRVIVVFS